MSRQNVLKTKKFFKMCRKIAEHILKLSERIYKKPKFIQKVGKFTKVKNMIHGL